MNTVLSVQGASAPVKKKSFFSKFTRLNMLRLARAVIPAAVLMMFFPHLAMAAQGAGQDLMQYWLILFLSCESPLTESLLT
ncbi:pilin [Escherichia coli P0304777.13]|nr:pilin [Escherichia coli P0304777.13]